ncbi:MAG: hypothetical protein ACLGSD_04710 [Acidobacteriota bacterium]
MSVFSITLAILGTTAEIFLLGILLRRGAARQVPAFIGYVYWLILSDIAMYAALGLNVYARVFPVEVWCDGMVLFVVLFDLARSVLRPLPRIASRSILLLLVGIVVGMAPIFWRISDSWLKDEWPGVWHSVIRMQMTLALLRILFLVLLGGLIQFLVNHFVRVGMGERELQIATGVGIYALASLAGSLLLTHPWSASVTVGIEEGESSIFFGVLIYWIVAFSTRAFDAAGISPRPNPLSDGDPSTLWKDPLQVTSRASRAGAV